MDSQDVGKQSADQAAGIAKKVLNGGGKAAGKIGKKMMKMLYAFIKKLSIAIIKSLAALLGPWGCLIFLVIVIVLVVISAVPFADWFMKGGTRSQSDIEADFKYEQSFKTAASKSVAELNSIEADPEWIAALINTATPSWGIPAALVRYQILMNDKKVNLADYDPEVIINNFKPSFYYTTISDDIKRTKKIKTCVVPTPTPRPPTPVPTPKGSSVPGHIVTGFNRADSLGGNISISLAVAKPTETTSVSGNTTITETIEETMLPAHDVLSQVMFSYGSIEINPLKRYYPGGDANPNDKWEPSTTTTSGNCSTSTFIQYEKTTVDDRYTPNLDINGPQFDSIFIANGVKEKDIKLIYEFIKAADPNWSQSQFSGDPMGGGGFIPGVAQVSEDVRRYEPLLRKYAEIYGVLDQLDLIMALIMQESGGRSLDVMQSSESCGLPANTITDPVISIDCGMKHFAKVFRSAGGDMNLTLQSYNFGGGFIAYCNTRGGYSKENVIAFSEMWAAKKGWERYGDINYVEHVMRYYKQDVNMIVSSEGQIFDVQAALNIMTQFLGMPYKWGGKTPKTSFDCSGLMAYTFGQLGINMNGNAATQYNKTYPISASDARPGDLVFWSTYKVAASHVGMYVGNDKFFNSNSKGIQYSSVSKWSNKYPFLGFRRIVR
ncbi:bifunctional lytic transglycosylase/C40 family peptidase [Paenibacillus sp. FSL P4-0288]|uniref:bifunctional lytic transglycosylase/C40 family peptidase n=1 Tax=Paenibacillus sp. FSL P4-0288 TaxID=2921633 RepID=UPI0030F72A0B